MKNENLTAPIDYFLDVVEEEGKKKKKIVNEIFKIESSDLAGQMALLYEKVRTAVQYKEEHLLRRVAIYRILKRLIAIEQRKNKREITMAFYLELLMAGYIVQKDANDENFLNTEALIAKYLHVLKFTNKLSQNPAVSLELRRWFLNLASEEIEIIITPQKEKMALVYAIYETFKPKTKFILDRPPYPLPGSKITGLQNVAEEYLGVGSLIEPIADTFSAYEKKTSSTKEEKLEKEKLLNMLLYIAIFRNLRKSDRAMLRSLVFNIHFPNWEKLTLKDKDEIEKTIKLFLIKKKEIEIIAEHPLITRILFPIKKYMLCASFFYEAIMENPKEARAIANQDFLLREKIKEKCSSRYLKERNKLKKRIFRGILYVFMTKMVLALLIELPYELYQDHTSINYQALAINLIFPPLLLWFIASSGKHPDEENTREIINGSEILVYEKKQQEHLKEIKITDRENPFAERILDLFYMVVFALVVYSLIKFLVFLQFNIVAIIIFTIFTGTVSFFGALIRQSRRDLVITKDKEGFISLLFDTIMLPFVRFGRLLSVKFSRINVLIFLLDFLVEAPFKFIIRAFEAWIGFLKRKRDEIERQLD